MIKFLAICLWNFSEWSCIPLSWFAPAVFGTMIGSKPKEVK